MAVFNINIINPVIKLFSNITEETNSCRSAFYFDIQTTPYNTINISIDNTGREDYIVLGAKDYVGHSGTRYEEVSGNIQATASGIIKARVIIENHIESTVLGALDGCNDATVTISDVANGIFSEQKKFNRCAGFSCDDFPPPEAVNDNYEVRKGSYSILDILSNDKPNTNYGVVTPTIVSQPSNGTVEVLSDGQVKYTHNGGASTTDSFTYKITNNIGQESSPATVSITIVDGQGAPQEITSNTVIHIYTQGYGQGSETTYINRAVENQLKEALISKYGTTSNYSSRVKVNPSGSGFGERFIQGMTNDSNLADNHDNAISIIFLGDAWDDYHNQGETYVGMTAFDPNDPLTTEYSQDIANFKNTLSGWDKSNYFSGILHVHYDDIVINNGEAFLHATEDGTGNYSGDNSLGSFSNIVFKYDIDTIEAGNTVTDQYYYNQIVTTLEQLGFTI